MALTALTSAAAKATSVAAALISVPLTLHYLGTERYGMWMILSALTQMLTFADFGIGNGVLTVVSRAHGWQDLRAVEAYVSSAFVLLSSVARTVLAAIALIYPHVEWFRLFNATSQIARAEAGPAIAIFALCFAFSIPFTIAQRVQLGLQMGFVVALWQCAASFATLAGVLIAIWLKAGLPWLVAVFAGTPMILAALNSLIFFGRTYPEFTPRFATASKHHAIELARIGLLFFILQAVVAIAFASDNLVIAQKLGAAAVAAYSVPDRLFAMASLVVGLAITPLWAAFGEAMARGDQQWVRRTLLRATGVAAFIAGGICALLVLIAPAILRVWVGPGVVQPSLELLLGLAVWRTVEAAANASSMYLNAVRVMRLQVAMAVALAIGTLSLELAFIRRFGVAVLPWSTAIVYVLVIGVPTVIYLRRHLFNEGSCGGA